MVKPRHVCSIALLIAGVSGSCSSRDSDSADVTLSFDHQYVHQVEAKYPAPSDVSIVSWLLYGDENRDRRVFVESVEFMTNCMREAGFDGYPRRPVPESFASPLTRPVGHLDPSLAASQGYASAEVSAPYADPVVAYYDSLTEPSRQAFDSMNSQCSAQERNLLFSGKFDEYEASRLLLEGKMINLFERFYASENVRAVYAGWSDCMARMGHNFSTPESAQADALDEPETPEGQAVMLAIASADADCRQATELEPRIAALFRAVESNFLIDNDGLVRAVMELSGRNVPVSTEDDE